MTPDEKQALLRERMETLGIVYTNDVIGKLLRYQMLIEEWNVRINLTGDAAFGKLLDKHLMDSLTPLILHGLLPPKAALIDIGSGAGLPGIPLAIVRPDLQVTLLDSLKKRVRFLNTVIETLDLTNVTAIHARAEVAAQNAQYRERFDGSVARAVATLPVLMELLLPFVTIGGYSICYKGPSVDEELQAGNAAARILGGGPPKVIPVSVPHLPEYRHCLVISEKRENTPKCFPRKAGTLAKNPIDV